MYGISSASTVSADLDLGIHSTVKLEKWAISRKVYYT